MKNVHRSLCGLVLLLSGVTAQAAPPAGAWSENEQKYGLFNVHLYVPAKVPAAPKRALTVVLHGCAQSVWSDIRDKKAGWEPVAEQTGMIIAAPDSPDSNPHGTRLVAGCWDWFGNAHQRGTRDIGLLADMIKGLTARTDLNIDPDQVYMVGMSSGAAVTQIFGCAYPELVAGVGLHSAPALGSMVLDSFGPPKVSAESVAERCTGYAGEHQAALGTQITSILQGEKDTMVHAPHAVRNREGLQLLYGAKEEAGKISETGNSNGMLYKDDAGRVRLAWIEVEGLGHAFSVGNGGAGGGIFHDYTHINYPAWVTKFFFENNLRVKR